ncbi:Signal transduction histidine kinase [Marinactinospora thermotolerans DSM 45154]|uniref:histidine kinase n=1 Tax=Marinactinospora thermotolerans DSM 45154 TaxID=1122192 RepID=A0A1T4R168_9ACTN|nr:Signal transduction histidine kinase [Marinactinospora thermotolerans DSM 45154]
MDLPGAPEPVPSTAPGRPEPSPPGAGNDAPAEEGGTPSSPAPGAEVPGAVPAQEEPRVSPTAGLAQPRPPSSAAPAPAEEAAPAPFQLDPRAAACVDSARREQLDPYVAPAALLFIDDPEQETTAGLMISREGIARISWVVLLVLVLTVAVSVTLSARLVRPVRALTDAVQRMRAGDGSARVEVADSGEIGRLAVAFNEMSEHLQRLEEQRKAMVSDVSHELRTPLSNLRGWLEAVQDGVADPEPERMAMLVEETLLLQRIIDDLQELALADAGRLRLSLGLVDAGELVEQSVASHRLHAETAGVELSARLSGDLTLVADRGRLLQAVGNLVGNALRHTPAGGRVTVTARGAGEAVVIEVADTGEGIAPEHLPHVFDRFWRAEKSRNRRTGGSGLGLAIVRNLAELHGGTAEVAAEPGRGAVFTLRLPRGRVPSGDGESGQG